MVGVSRSGLRMGTLGPPPCSQQVGAARSRGWQLGAQVSVHRPTRGNSGAPPPAPTRRPDSSHPWPPHLDPSPRRPPRRLRLLHRRGPAPLRASRSLHPRAAPARPPGPARPGQALLRQVLQAPGCASPPALSPGVPAPRSCRGERRGSGLPASLSLPGPRNHPGSVICLRVVPDSSSSRLHPPRMRRSPPSWTAP